MKKSRKKVVFKKKFRSDLELEPDPLFHESAQNEMDPQHYFKHSLTYTLCTKPVLNIPNPLI